MGRYWWEHTDQKRRDTTTKAENNGFIVPSVGGRLWEMWRRLCPGAPQEERRAPGELEKTKRSTHQGRRGRSPPPPLLDVGRDNRGQGGEESRALAPVQRRVRHLGHPPPPKKENWKGGDYHTVEVVGTRERDQGRHHSRASMKGTRGLRRGSTGGDS